MKLPTGEDGVCNVRLDTLESYLQRGDYERMSIVHSSYDTICGYLPDIGPASTVAVDGPTNSGKTSLAKALAGFYEERGIPVAYLPLDHFLTDRATRNEINRTIEDSRLDIADYSAAAWEQQRYRHTIQLAQNIARSSPEPRVLLIPNAYDRKTGTTASTQSVIIHPGSIVVSEGVGIQTYHDELFNIKIRVDVVDNAILLKRVLERENQKPEGVTRLPDDYLQTRFNTVDAPHTSHLRTNAPTADFIVDTSNFREMLLYIHR